MRMLLPRLIGLLAMIPALTAPTLAAPAFQEGEWEITIRTEIPGVPFTPPPVTMHQCLTHKDRIPQGKDIAGECKVVDQRSSGNTMRWTMRCGNANGITEAKGEVTYSGKTMQGVSHTTTSGKSGSMRITSRMAGHRIGPCR